MKSLSYGISRPDHLFEKLKLDAGKVTENADPFDVFNFVVTAAVLAEWLENCYRVDGEERIFGKPNKENNWQWVLPEKSKDWINTKRCIPNLNRDFMVHISNVLSICDHTANASKHFHWGDKGSIKEISEHPDINSWYQYFFTGTSQDIYVDYEGEVYGLIQIKEILLQFYSGLLPYLEATRRR